MTAAQALRHAADVVEDSAIGDRMDLTIQLWALHIVRACGAGEQPEEARILMRLLEG